VYPKKVNSAPRGRVTTFFVLGSKIVIGIENQDVSWLFPDILFDSVDCPGPVVVVVPLADHHLDSVLSTAMVWR